jgi:DNA polymerase III subunit delta'
MDDPQDDREKPGVPVTHPWNEALIRALAARSEKLPHALLIHGMKGTGKLALAERLAQLLLCESPEPQRRPCGACDACRWFLAGNHPDFRRLEPEALAPERDPETIEEEGGAPAKRGKPSIEIKVDQVRALADFLNIGSHRGRLRVALVHPAEDMNPSAANALLKGLEEPPLGAMFLLVSHRPAQLLPTVRSRCVAVPVSLPPRDLALHWLSAQGIKDSERWLAYAGGAPLRAVEYAAEAAAYDRLLQDPGEATDRDELMRLAEVLQKTAFDQALSAFGLPRKYGTPGTPPRRDQAHAWLTHARQMGHNRLLSSHPLNPRLFSLEMLAGQPDEQKK